MGLFSMVTELWMLLNCRKRPPANRAAEVTLCATLEQLEQEQSAEAATRNSRCLQPSGRVELRPEVAFPKNYLEHRSV